MAEYRIVATLDPSGVVGGSQRTKQELRSLEGAANSTGRKVAGAFSDGKVDRALRDLVSRLTGLETRLDGVASSNATMASSNDRLAQTIDRLASATSRGTSTTETSTNSGKKNAASKDAMRAATMRVLQAVDQEAAELAKLNRLLEEAAMLHAKGAISGDQFAAVQRRAAAAAKGQAEMTNLQRAGLQQLNFQIGDVATMYALGARPSQIFASQIGQVTQAVQMASGGTSKWAAFLGGPWGIALTTATILLAPFIGKLFESGDAIENELQKLRKDAEEHEATSQAKERFKNTTEGARAAVIDYQEALDKQNDSLRTAAERTRDNIAATLNDTIARRENIITTLKQAAAYEKLYTSNLRNQLGAEGSAGFDVAAGEASGRVADLESQIAVEQGTIASLRKQLSDAQSSVDVEAGKRANDKVEQIRRQYEGPNGLIEQARKRAVAEGKVGAALEAQVKALDAQMRKKIEAQQKLDSAANRSASSTPGVATFRSREQAIGIAGREFQSRGLDVSGNSQFRRTSGHANDAYHNRYKIDVDVPGATDKAPTPPNIRSQYDAIAKRYAARGYRVLWAGLVYEPDGSTRPITGKDKHFGHMDIEAPSMIVGKTTGASTESQAARQEREQAQVAARADDFVQRVVDSAAAQSPAAADRVKNEIGKVAADFRRQFDRELTVDERGRVEKAITDADARAIAQAFETAYVEPLDRLRALQGKTGMEREILNRQLDETKRIGRELTPVEKEMIRNSVEQGAALTEQNAILESIKKPLDDYRLRLAALIELLQQGKITQAEFNAQVRDLPMNVQNRDQAARLMPGGQNETAAKLQRMEEEAQQERDLAAQLRELRIIDEQEEKRRLLEIERNYQVARRDIALGAAEDLFKNLGSIAETAFGKQSAVYKAAFAAEKAIAIARSIMAIQTGIAQAMSLPFPANLAAAATVAAQAASIVANIQAVRLNFADGGYVRGPGGSRTDSVPANLSNGEFVMNANATRKNRAVLEAMNSGASVAGRSAGAASSAAVQTGDTYQISFGDVVVQNPTGGEQEGRAFGAGVRKELHKIIDDRIHEQGRSGGMLTRVRSSNVR